MSLRIKSLRASALLAGGEGLAYGLAFVRNMLFARLLTKTDFGIAAACAMVITLFEFSAKLSVGRFVIQYKEGNRPDFIATAHFVQCVTAFLSSLLLAAAASPLALLFGLGDQRMAFYVLAIIPFLRGFEHMDVRRFERDIRFAPSALIEVVPQVIITLAAWPAARVFGDYRAVLILLIAKVFLSCVLSHWLAERPYRWQFNRDYIAMMLRFGWPLVVNGFLMFAVFQGNQLLVGTFYTMAHLGAYAAASALAQAPTFIFGKVFNSVMFPLLAKVQDDKEAFCRRYHQSLAVLSTFAAVYAVGLIIGSEALMRFVYGQKYVGTGVLLACLAASNTLRNIRLATGMAAMAKGDSKNQMISNSWRIVSLAPALALAVAGKPIWMIACTGLVGEVFACRASFARLRQRDRVPWSTTLIPTGWVALAILLAFAVTKTGIPYWNPYLAIAIAVFGAIATGALMILLQPILRKEADSLWLRLRSKGWRSFHPLRWSTDPVAVATSPKAAP